MQLPEKYAPKPAERGQAAILLYLSPQYAILVSDQLLLNYFYYIGITRSVKPQSSPRPWNRQAVGRIIPPRPVGGEDFKAECPIVRQ